MSLGVMDALASITAALWLEGSTMPDAPKRGHRAVAASLTAPTIVVIDRRPLIRDCLMECFGLIFSDCRVLGFVGVEEWEDASDEITDTTIVLCSTDGNAGLSAADLRRLSRPSRRAVLVVISDSDDTEQARRAMECGARGFIPTSMSLQAAIWAVNLVRAGGTYIPASTLVTRQEDDDPYPDRAARTFKTLTAREFEILDALGRGKANKQIAYELDLAEGTVKVHLSKIMKKMKARNRTEVALMASKRPKS